MRTSIAAFDRYLVVEGDPQQITGLWISDTPEEDEAVGELANAIRQLKEYEAGTRTAFELKIGRAHV